MEKIANVRWSQHSEKNMAILSRMVWVDCSEKLTANKRWERGKVTNHVDCGIRMF